MLNKPRRKKVVVQIDNFKKNPEPIPEFVLGGATIDLKFNNSPIKEMSQEYVDYIQSDKWKRKRKIALKRAGYRCQMCNSPHSLQVHHRTYERFGNENMTDLTVVCNGCHLLFHSHRKVYQF